MAPQKRAETCSCEILYKYILIMIAKERLVLDCIFLYICILLSIENSGDVPPEKKEPAGCSETPVPIYHTTQQ